MASCTLLIVDDLASCPNPPLARTLLQALLLAGSALVTFNECTEFFRLNNALLERLIRHIHTLENNRGSYRLKNSQQNDASRPPNYSGDVWLLPERPRLTPATADSGIFLMNNSCEHLYWRLATDGTPSGGH